MSRPLVNIVMTTYNREKILPRAIESVLRQPYEDWELIIGNDASTDNTQSIIDQYCWKYSRIRCVERKESSADEQKRVGKAIEPVNDGLRKMNPKTEYIAHLDDDDLYWPDRLNIPVKILEENPQFDMIYGDYIGIMMKDGKEVIGRAYRRDFDANYLLTKGNFFSNMETMYRKNVYDKIGDWSFSIKGGRDKRMGRIGSDGNYWRRVCSAGFIIAHIPFIMGVTISKSHPDFMNPDRDFWKIKEWSCRDDNTGEYYGGGKFTREVIVVPESDEEAVKVLKVSKDPRSLEEIKKEMEKLGLKHNEISGRFEKEK